MADLLGPASAAGSVTSRPTDPRVFGNDDTWFVGCSSPDSEDGTEINAEFLNAVLAQVRSAIRGMGAPIDNASDDMLLNAIKLARLRYAVDTGAADAMIVTLNPPIAAYATELTLLVKVSDSNATPAPTINVDGKGAKTIKGADGAALAPGDLAGAHVAMLAYDGTDFRLIARWQAPSSGLSSYHQPGELVLTFAETPLPGTYELDGSAISRSLNPTLFARYGVKYGAGDGTTTFNLPDVRGEFLRCWDHGAARDPDRASRAARADGVLGDKVGTKQAAAFASHSHSGTLSGVTSLVTDAGVSGSTGDPNSYVSNMGGDFNYHGLVETPAASIGIAAAPAGGNETRPRNINVLCCVAGG